MTRSAPTSDSFLTQLWSRHNQAIRERVENLAEATRLLACNQLSPEQQRQAVADAHKLAGSLGTFGATSGSEDAREIELALESARSLSPAEVAHLNLLADHLLAVLDQISKRMMAADADFKNSMEETNVPYAFH